MVGSVETSLVGRDPTTDVAVLRFQPDGLPTAAIAKAPLRAGDVIFAVGNHGGTALAAFGTVALAGGAWRSSRGGTIDEFLRLDLTLSPAGEGGALIDAQGRVLGMTVLGPRRRALAIPTSTIERAVDQLLARGHVFRAYLGAGLRSLRGERRQDSTPASSGGRGVLVVDVDPEGPAKRAGAAIRLVAGELAVFPQKLLTKLSDKPGTIGGRSNETEGGSTRLSKRERAVLTAIADGLSNEEIARRLAISFHTVKFHVASILEKLEVDTRTEAVIKAAQLGLVML